MTNREKLHWQALGDLMLTICECRFKKCPIEIVGMKKPACVPATASTEKCKRCVMEWMNEECEK